LLTVTKASHPELRAELLAARQLVEQLVLPLLDQRITELLARERQLFDEFARVSDMADSSPEAVDLSEAELVHEVLAAERKRLAERVSDHGR
jgi:hypothetical protein